MEKVGLDVPASLNVDTVIVGAAQASSAVGDDFVDVVSVAGVAGSDDFSPDDFAGCVVERLDVADPVGDCFIKPHHTARGRDKRISGHTYAK